MGASVIFRSVYRTPGAVETLYMLLKERTPEQSISHKTMPTQEEHRAFVMSMPYVSWMLLEDDQSFDRTTLPSQRVVGSVYVSKQNEVGIFIFRRFQRRGYGREALEWARTTFRDRQLYANIAPANEASRAFFERHGATHIQNTFKL